MVRRMRKAEFGSPGTTLREQLVSAVLRGEKTATAGLLVDYERDGESLPELGECQAVVDNDGRDVAVIEITEVRVLRIGDADLSFARDEGEGFESVADWRAAHDRYWRGYADEVRESWTTRTGTSATTRSSSPSASGSSSAMPPNLPS
jgi:uncharacterized protein YhfF